MKFHYLCLLFLVIFCNSCKDDDKTCGCTPLMRFDVRACDNPWEVYEEEGSSLEENAKRYFKRKHVQISSFEQDENGVREACPSCCKTGKRIFVNVPLEHVDFLKREGFILEEE